MPGKTIGVLLAGSGVYDGTEIHEATFVLLALDKLGHTARCMAPNKPQHDVIDHRAGDAVSETRNVLTESARIARGQVDDLATVAAEELDGLCIPGGFGAAKNLNQWAISGPDGAIDANVQALIRHMHAQGKPIFACCMGPTVLAKAFAGTQVSLSLTVGSTEEASPYDIAAIGQGMQSLGATVVNATIREHHVDQPNRVVTAPAYMMEASIAQVQQNIESGIVAFHNLLG